MQMIKPIVMLHFVVTVVCFRRSGSLHEVSWPMTANRMVRYECAFLPLKRLMDGRCFVMKTDDRLYLFDCRRGFVLSCFREKDLGITLENGVNLETKWTKIKKTKHKKVFFLNLMWITGKSVNSVTVISKTNHNDKRDKECTHMKHEF